MGDTFKSIARDQAYVGVQVGRAGTVNSGGIPARADHRDLGELLEEIRGDLDAARQRDEVDTAIADAVAEELNEAAAALPATDERSENRYVVALKKAKGLVEGLAGLTQKIAAAIAAVHDLQ